MKPKRKARKRATLSLTGWTPINERDHVDFTGAPIARFCELTNRERREILTRYGGGSIRSIDATRTLKPYARYFTNR